MIKSIKLGLLIMLLFNGKVVFAQPLLSGDMKEAVKTYNLKINELYDKHTKNGFVVYKEQKLPMQANLDFVINFKLIAGSWYHFSFVGDPSSSKIKAVLFKEGFGDMVQARLFVDRENEFWTEFSFICPQTGIYELSLFQKNEISRPLSYLTIFKKTLDVTKTN